MLITRNTPINKNILRLAAIIAGFFLWSIFAQFFPITMPLTVPVTVPPILAASTKVSSPTVTVQVRGNRQQMRSIDKAQLRYQIPATLKKGDTTLTPTARALGLPKGIIVINHAPTPLIATRT